MNQFISDTHDGYWPVNRIVHIKRTRDGPRCETDTGEQFTIGELSFDRLIDPAPIIPATPGYVVWLYSPDPGEDPAPFEGDPVIAWAINGVGAPTPITDGGGLETSDHIAICRPDGSFIIPDDCYLNDLSAFRQHVLTQQRKQQDRNAKAGSGKPELKAV